MKKRLNIFKKALFFATPVVAITPLFTLSLSCGAQRPEVGLIEDKDKTNPNFVYKDGKKLLKGSASEFRGDVLSSPNIVDEGDPAYQLYEFEKDADGNDKIDPITKKRIIKMNKEGNLAYPELNVSKDPSKFKELYSKYLTFNNIKRQYEFRAYAFTPDEFERYFPYSYGSYRKYINSNNRKRTLLLTVYYMEKSSIAYDNQIDYRSNIVYYEGDITVSKRWKQVLDDSYTAIWNSLSQQERNFIINPKTGNYTNHSEGLWPFFPMHTINGEGTYIKDKVAYPVLLEFEKE